MCGSIFLHVFCRVLMNLNKLGACMCLGVNQKHRLACYVQLFDPSDYEVADVDQSTL